MVGGGNLWNGSETLRQEANDMKPVYHTSLRAGTRRRDSRSVFLVFEEQRTCRFPQGELDIATKTKVNVPRQVRYTHWSHGSEVTGH